MVPNELMIRMLGNAQVTLPKTVVIGATFSTGKDSLRSEFSVQYNS